MDPLRQSSSHPGAGTPRKSNKKGVMNSQSAGNVLGAKNSIADSRRRTSAHPNKKEKGKQKKKSKSPSRAGMEANDNADTDNEADTPSNSVIEQVITPHDVAEGLCKEVADEWLDFAMDICLTNFVYEKGAEIVAWDFRDSCLDMVTMNWLDTEASIGTHDCSSVSIFKVRDDPALPPKFDFWSHGALELLPNMCRESVMDPFLRDPLPWYLANLQDNDDRPLKEQDTNERGTNTNTETTNKALLLPTVDSKKILPRPTSPVPTETDEGTWSTSSSMGASFDNVKKEKGKQKEGSLSPPPMSAATMTKRPKDKEGSDKKSIELLYPTSYPSAEIKASTEIAYSMGWKDNDTPERGQLIAFKLPNQTSSESFLTHVARQEKKQPDENTE